MEKHQKGREKQYHKRCLGITVLYGDPAWQVKMKRTTEPLYDLKLDIVDTQKGRKKITIILAFNRDCTFNERYVKPPVALLQNPVSDWKVEKSDANETIVADNFIMLDLTGKQYKKGDKVVAVVTCRILEAKSIDASKAKNYTYLSKNENASALTQIGDEVVASGVPIGSLCYHGGILWSKYLHFTPGEMAPCTYEMPGEKAFRTDNLCSDGKFLWSLDTWQKKLQGFAVKKREGKLRLQPEPGKVLSLPWANPAAVTFANGNFYILDSMHKKIFVIGTTGETKGGFPVPSETVTDMAYDGKYFWAVDGKRKTAYMFEEHGVIVLRLPLPFAPAGIAHDGESLWISSAGKNNALYQLRLNDKQKYTRGKWMDAEVRFSIRGPGACYIALPEDSNRQKVAGKITLLETSEIVADNWKQKAAKFSGKGQWKLRVRLFRIRYNIIPERVGKFSEIPKEIHDAYTIDGDMLKLTSEPLKEAKQEVEKLIKKWKKERNPYWVARCAYEYLIQKVHYERIPGWIDAPTLLARGTGTCSPISFAYVAICRALGLPARFSAGTRYRGKDPCIDQEFHRWCEVYLPNFGWVPVDPSATGKSPSPHTAITRWGYVPETDLVMTRGGGGSTIFGWAYNGAGGQPQAHWSNTKSSKD
jgi:hypothetical protein